MPQRNRFAIIAAGLTVVFGGGLLAVTSLAATRTPAPVVRAPVAVDSAAIAKDHATAAALAKVPGGAVKKSETECEDGRLVYSFEIATSSGITKVSVDALTGVASTKVDDDDDEQPGAGIKEGKKGHHEDADDGETEDDDDGGSCTAGPHHAKSAK